MSICAWLTASFIGFAMYGLSVPNASEWTRTRSVPPSPRSTRTRSISPTASAQRSGSAAFTLKKRASRPSARIAARMRSAFASVALRSRCTPKMFMPARASARLVASPKPEEAPRMSAQPVGPTHDDVTIEGVARAMGVPVVRHPRLVATLEGYYRGELNDAHLKMAETPEGAELVGGEPVRFPTILMRNVYVLPGVPEIFRAKFEALRERFRDAPIHLKNVFVSIGEGELADYLNGLLADFPLLLLGSYPEFSNPEYRVKVTLESRDPGYLEKALAELLRRLPVRAVVQVT